MSALPRFVMYAAFGVVTTGCADEDPFLLWQEDVRESLTQCMSETPATCSEEARSCGARALGEHPPPIDRSTAAAQFQTEMWAGHLLVSVADAAAILRRCLGMDVRWFSGSGKPIPFNESYASARSREYLTPNWHETADHVWGFELPATQESLDLLVRDVVESRMPTPASNSVPFATKREEVLRKLEDPLEELPPVIRLRLLKRAKHQGTMTASDKQRTFFLDARSAWDLTLGEAAAAVGFEMQPKDEQWRVYLWIFVPELAQDRVPATWGNIFENLPTWLAPNMVDEAVGASGEARGSAAFASRAHVARTLT